MMAGLISLSLAILAVQTSCVLCRKDFYHYFFSLYKGSSTTEMQPTFSTKGSSTTELSQSLSTLGFSTTEIQSLISTKDDLGDITDGSETPQLSDFGNDVRTQFLAGRIIGISIGSIIVASTLICCCVICYRCCCYTSRPTYGYVLRNNQQPQVPAPVTHGIQDVYHPPPSEQLPSDPPPYDTQPVPQQYYPHLQQPQYYPTQQQQFQQSQPAQQWSTSQFQQPSLDVQNRMTASAPPYQKY